MTPARNPASRRTRTRIYWMVVDVNYDAWDVWNMRHSAVDSARRMSSEGRKYKAIPCRVVLPPRKRGSR